MASSSSSWLLPPPSRRFLVFCSTYPLGMVSVVFKLFPFPFGSPPPLLRVLVRRGISGVSAVFFRSFCVFSGLFAFFPVLLRFFRSFRSFPSRPNASFDVTKSPNVVWPITSLFFFFSSSDWLELSCQLLSKTRSRRGNFRSDQRTPPLRNWQSTLIRHLTS